MCTVWPNHGLPGSSASVHVLADRRCIQLDPLDQIGTNADLVVLARVDEIRRGDVYGRAAAGARV